MIELLQEATEEIQRLCKVHHVRYLAVFGSAARESATTDSDVDFLVEFSDGLSAKAYASAYFQLKDDLESLLGRPVDLVTARSLNNPYFLKSIMADQQALYAA